MMDFLVTNMVYVLETTLATSLVLVLVLWFAWDRQKARYIEHRLVMSTYVAKARTDRNDKVRIPTTQICDLFELQERTVPNWKRVTRPHPHPATLPTGRNA